MLKSILINILFYFIQYIFYTFAKKNKIAYQPRLNKRKNEIVSKNN